MYSLRTEYHFDSAHFLTNYYGKCENLHGHRWKVVVTISVPELQQEGTEKDMVIDFGVFKKQVHALCDEFDHRFIIEDGSLAKETLRCLEAEGFCLKIVPWRTTAENFATHFMERLTSEGLPVQEVQVFETPNNCAIVSA